MIDDGDLVGSIHKTALVAIDNHIYIERVAIKVEV